MLKKQKHVYYENSSLKPLKVLTPKKLSAYLGGPTERPLMWQNETNLERVIWCVKMLEFYGFLTDLERDRILKRVRAWRDKIS